MSKNQRLKELGRFLKDRRARVMPLDVGLPSGSRRRVHGLRREEVASLAGIGVSWYTLLENGDAHGISEATLRLVADALRLSEPEQEYVLALIGPPPYFEAVSEPEPSAAKIIHALAFPAYIITAGWDVLDCNAAFRNVWAVSQDEVPFNAIERLFLDPRARKMHGEQFVANIRPVIAMLRSTHGRLHWQTLQTLRDRLLEDEIVRAIWVEYEVTSPSRPNRCTIQSPIGTFQYETFTLPMPGTAQALVVQIPERQSRAFFHAI